MSLDFQAYPEQYVKIDYFSAIYLEFLAVMVRHWSMSEFAVPFQVEDELWRTGLHGESHSVCLHTAVPGVPLLNLQFRYARPAGVLYLLRFWHSRNSESSCWHYGAGHGRISS